MKALRQTVDLSAYPDLVVVYLGMTVNVLTGVKTLFGFGPKIEGSVAARPDGLLLHENIFYSLFPLHVVGISVALLQGGKMTFCKGSFSASQVCQNPARQTRRSFSSLCRRCR